MFHFIEPKEQYLYKDDILAFLEGVASSPKLYEAFENWEEGSFLLAQELRNNRNDSPFKNRDHDHREKCVKGGALLLKQPTDLLQPRIQAYIKTCYPQMKDVWTGLISLQVHEDITGRDFERICRLFYCTLLADLTAFSVKVGSPFVCVSMTPFEHTMIEREDVWPYVAQVKPESSRDGLFHGVLSLLDITQNTVLPQFTKQTRTLH